MREGFFEQDGLAGLRRGDGRFPMKPVGQADADRIQAGEGEECVKVAEGLCAGCCRHGCHTRRIAVADADQFGRQVLAVDARVARAEIAKSDNADLERPAHVWASGIFQPRKSSMKAASSATTAPKNFAPFSGVASEGSPSVPLGERSAKSW